LSLTYLDTYSITYSPGTHTGASDWQTVTPVHCLVKHLHI